MYEGKSEVGDGQASSPVASATNTVDVLGSDYVFPNELEGLPARLSDFEDLQIKSLKTSDGVKQSYWEAGQGKPLIFVLGWAASGAEYIHVMYLLRKHYRVLVLDPRNQGLSQRVDYGARIARFAVDLRDFSDHWIRCAMTSLDRTIPGNFANTPRVAYSA
ncbi:alpha/beta hydrolase [Burkholderia sp. Ac-20353]|uniref:alpha/beta fold hydrolase n=1 Tax=Burkholderia sp. Ac-20353 TaxID=2703894 RepID=UPI001F11B31A|nr:alpha/beta hydrolase [Burkholderia sp. Ac-20353]